MASGEKIVTEKRKQIVEDVFKQLYTQHSDTRIPWDLKISCPRNPFSQKEYKGANKLALMTAAIENGYKDPRWFTESQAKENGVKLLPGQKGVLCEQWVIDQEELKAHCREEPFAKFYVVYNAEQCEGIAPLFRNTKQSDKELQDKIDRLIRSSRCPIIETTTDMPLYNPLVDRILMPIRQSFVSQEEFLGCLAHEMAHSTGHHDRLNRKLVRLQNSRHQIEKEELRAELSSVFVCNKIHPDGDGTTVISEANRLGFPKLMKDFKRDSDEFFQIVADSEKIADYIIKGYHQEVLEECKREKGLEAKVGAKPAKTKGVHLEL